jgi:hypothetical protein
VEKLSLSHNKFSSLPKSIEKLVKVNDLNLSNNLFTEFSVSISKLTAMQKLNLAGNRITVLSQSIGNLVAIQELNLENNPLRTLSDSIGYMIELRKISLKNTDIESLPMSLGNCLLLNNIDIFGTRIPVEQQEAIMNRCRASRDEDGALSLFTRIDTWKAYSGKNYSFGGLLKKGNFDDQKLKDLNSWLKKLEESQDFASRRKETAVLVCNILDTVSRADETGNKEFKDAFFLHIDGNLEACGDRAAMLLNIIYTDWKICTLSPNATDKQKLAIMIGLSKTITLRNAIQYMLAQIQGRGESAEIYLYYETKLKAQLGLETAIENLLYDFPGKKFSEQQVQELVNQVINNHLDTLVNYEALASKLDKILENDKVYGEKYQAECEAISDRAEEEMIELFNSKEDHKRWPKVQDYMNANKKLMDDRNNNIALIKKKYIKLILA